MRLSPKTLENAAAAAFERDGRIVKTAAAAPFERDGRAVIWHFRALWAAVPQRGMIRFRSADCFDSAVLRSSIPQCRGLRLRIADCFNSAEGMFSVPQCGYCRFGWGVYCYSLFMISMRSHSHFLLRWASVFNESAEFC